MSALFICCTSTSQTEKDLRATINKEVSLEIFDLVRRENTFLTLEDLKQRYDYLSVVYLQNGDLLTISNTPKQQRHIFNFLQQILPLPNICNYQQILTVL